MNISVVIPAYNAAQSLPDCLNSVSDARAEIIVVDDGSTDDTAAVAGKRHCVRLVRQENRGVSAARNTGLSRAGGEFMVFLDADDTLADGALAALDSLIPDCRADMIVMRSFSGSSEKYPWKQSFRDGSVQSKDEIMSAGYLRGSICGCAFRKSFLQENQLSFAEGVPLSEDLLFWACCLSANATVLFRDIPFYRVCERADSASRKMDPDYLRRYSLSLEAAVRDIADPSLRTAVCLSVMMGMIHMAAPAGYSPSWLLKETMIPAALPLPVAGTFRNRVCARLVNASFPLFYRLKQLRDLC